MAFTFPLQILDDIEEGDKEQLYMTGLLSAVSHWKSLAMFVQENVQANILVLAHCISQPEKQKESLSQHCIMQCSLSAHYWLHFYMQIDAHLDCHCLSDSIIIPDSLALHRLGLVWRVLLYHYVEKLELVSCCLLLKLAGFTFCAHWCRWSELMRHLCSCRQQT